MPNIWTNPYVICVGDHATHFDLTSLKRLIHEADFEVVFVAEDFIAGELTLLARKSAVGKFHNSQDSQTLVKTDRSLHHATLVDSLLRVSSWLTWQRNSSQTLGIFGTSVAGTWAGSCLEFRHDYWVDEDSSRMTRSWMGKNIIPPSKVRVEDLVVIILAPIKVERIVRRLQASTKMLNFKSPLL